MSVSGPRNQKFDMIRHKKSNSESANSTISNDQSHTGLSYPYSKKVELRTRTRMIKSELQRSHTSNDEIKLRKPHLIRRKFYLS